jgi:hypothetical protein
MPATCQQHGSNMAATCQQHGSNMAATWQQHGSNMAATWQQHGSNMAATWQQHASSASNMPATCQQHASNMPASCTFSQLLASTCADLSPPRPAPQPPSSSGQCCAAATSPTARHCSRWALCSAPCPLLAWRLAAGPLRSWLLVRPGLCSGLPSALRALAQHACQCPLPAGGAAAGRPARTGQGAQRAPCTARKQGSMPALASCYGASHAA